MRVGYRIQQFLAALSLRHEPVEDIALTPWLSPAQVALFRCMSASEQRHALAVLYTLQREGHSEAILMQAALLHDAGKAGGGVRLWHRVATVLLLTTHLALLRRLALNKPGSWRYPFFIQLQHAERGAEMAARAGTEVPAVDLIRCHHAPTENGGLGPTILGLLAALRSADEEH